jgi:hypothetical protein
MKMKKRDNEVCQEKSLMMMILEPLLIIDFHWPLMTLFQKGGWRSLKKKIHARSENETTEIKLRW